MISPLCWKNVDMVKKKMKNKYLLLLVLILISSCSARKEPVVYDMQGYIEDVRIDSEGTFVNILVNGKSESTSGPLMTDYGWAKITEETKIFLNGEEVEFYPFQPDSNVNVFVKYAGAIMESYPVQGTAKIVFINDN